MALSDSEQRRLEEIERALEDESPLIRRPRRLAAVSLLLIGMLVLLIGLVMTAVTLVVGIVISVVGAAISGAALFFAGLHWS